MRVVYFFILVVVLAAVAVFAVQNNERVTLTYFNWKISSSMALLIAVVYLLGMLSGWTVVGFLTRSWRRVVDRRKN
jgi:uncharacterized integral membrane protein